MSAAEDHALIDQDALPKDAPRLIGFAGPKGVGKTTAAHLLLEYGFHLASFTEPFKAMLRAMLRVSAFDHDLIERMVDGDLKDNPADVLYGKTPRFALQSLGTDWGRGMIAPEIWIGTTMSAVGIDLSLDRRVVIEGVRTAAEAAAMRTHGGEVWRIHRPDVAYDPDHATEICDFDCDVLIENDGCLDKFEGEILAHLLG